MSNWDFKSPFESLKRLVKNMGAADREFNIDFKMEKMNSIDIDFQLKRGLDVSIDDIDIDPTNGLLSYKGRQILLYIQDHGERVSLVLDGTYGGNKFHVADCSTLKEMRVKKRFDRYVVTNDITQDFFISGIDIMGNKKVTGEATLTVCKNCLNHIHYRDYGKKGKGVSKTKIFKNFDLDEFFKTYSSFFTKTTNNIAGVSSIDAYPDDWNSISKNYKKYKNYICEQCHVDLSGNKKYLHTHHVSGVKKDCSSSNLMALCVECHRAQPLHGNRIVVTSFASNVLPNLRREQGLPPIDRYK